MQIIMASAKALPAERAAGIAAGANGYLIKPFDEAQLLDVLRRHLPSSSGEAVIDERQKQPSSN